MSFEDLKVWKKSCELVIQLYTLLKNSKEFWIKEQILKAALSVSSNIAEGSARTSKKEKNQFYGFAKSSLVEVDCLSEISFNQNYFPKEDYRELLNLINTTAYLLMKFISAVKT